MLDRSPAPPKIVPPAGRVGGQEGQRAVNSDSDVPIYAQLIRERGDVPGDVRREAEQIQANLERVIMPFRPGLPTPGFFR